MELSLEEKQFFQKAVEIARKINRPFTEREVLSKARREGYELKLCFDPRFVKVAPRQGATLPLWILDENNEERLKRVYFNDFFCALADYVQHSRALAQLEAKKIAFQQSRDVSLKRNGRQQPISEIEAQLLTKQGWTW